MLPAGMPLQAINPKRIPLLPETAGSIASKHPRALGVVGEVVDLVDAQELVAVDG